MIANQLMGFIIEGNWGNEKYMEGYMTKKVVDHCPVQTLSFSQIGTVAKVGGTKGRVRVKEYLHRPKSWYLFIDGCFCDDRPRANQLQTGGR